MAWPVIVAAGIAALAQLGGMYADKKKQDRALSERRKEKESEERVAMEQLGLKREEMGLLEKQRGFNRFKNMASFAPQIQDRTRRWQRLRNLRQAM